MHVEKPPRFTILSNASNWTLSPSRSNGHALAIRNPGVKFHYTEVLGALPEEELEPSLHEETKLRASILDDKNT
jgi:hypothetical protein